MHKLLERFDALATTLVVLVYLSAMFVGTATLFAGSAFGLTDQARLIVAFCLAFAFEVHSFASIRTVRRLHGQLNAPNHHNQSFAERSRLENLYRLHFGITIALVAFSILNSCAYQVIAAQPTDLGGILFALLRGFVVPLAFLGAGFLTPLGGDMATELRRTIEGMQRSMYRAAQRQWRKRIRFAARRGADLVEPLAQLTELQEAGDVSASVMIRTIHGAILAAEEGGTYHPPLPAPTTPYPTGGGTPLGRHTGTRPYTDLGDMPVIDTGDRAGEWASVLNGVPSASEAAAIGQLDDGNDSPDAVRMTALQAAADVYLDANPGMTRAALRKLLGVRQETASGLYAAWQLDRASRRRAQVAQVAQVAQ